jgi:hypothetical protein
VDGYREIATSADMDELLALVGGFHDGVAKELHILNRAFVAADHTMTMTHAFDLSLVVQLQSEPSAVELVFRDVKSLSIGEVGDVWSATGEVASGSVRLAFDRGLTVESERLFARLRPDWLGPSLRLAGEVPSPQAVSATALEDDWRLCSACGEAWQEPPSIEWSRCPACLVVTRLSAV